MIISHKYKFIFIKTRKTGGSSIEKYLLDYLEGTDYVFGGMPPEGLRPYNVEGDQEHKGWRWIKENYPVEWNSYYKFAVDRNPWDRYVSAYYWYKSAKPKKVKHGWDEFIRRPGIHEHYVEWKLYANDNDIVVDKLVQFEKLHETFKELPIPYNDELLVTHLKKTVRPNYRSMYNNETKALVEKSCKNVIDYFKYTF